ncbi:MAG: M56 family metallopeptidase [Oscillospiraceae bacterium]|nr:M56 family metallopeptidase [Oscillospiraceae bacterium]
MNVLLDRAVSMSLAGSVLILLLTLLRPLVRERISRRWQYYIWLLVIARLLLPVGGLEAPAKIETAGPAAAPFLSLPEAEQEDVETRPPGEAAPEFDDSLKLRTAVRENLWVVWLAGALALLIRKATAYQSFLRYLRAGWMPVEDPALLDLAARIGAEAGVKRPVELYVNPLAASPMLLGVRKPCVVLPTAELPEEDFRFVLLHELTHYRRRDLPYKWLTQLTVCVHWFNPLVHWMAREVERTGELSCDEAVLRRLDGPGRRAYGDAILRTISAGGGYQAVHPSTALGAEGKHLKERLETIMKFKKTGRLSAVLAALLAVVLGVTGAAAGIYAGLPTVKTGTSYRYTMESYYEAPYIFGIGWDLPKEEGTSASIALPDGGKLKVCFTDAAKGVIQDKKAMGALAKVLARLREETRDTDFPMTRPLVYRWKDTGGDSQETLAERYYKEGDLPSFKAVFAELDRPEQASWMAKIYEDGNYAFFSAAASGLETDSDLVTAFAEKAYAGGAAGHFSILVDRMSEETLGLWLERAVKDKQFAFRSILYNKLGMDSELDELKAWLDTLQAVQYKAVGVTMEGRDYYYKGELVNIFLDLHRPDNSINTLNMNPEGTINIKIVRNEKGDITGAAELTQEEIEELFGEDDGQDWDWDEDWDDDEWDWDWDNEKWAEEEKRLAEEYAVHGVIKQDGKNYYYQGRLVYIFLDRRTDGGLYTLNMNPEGTANIKIVRNKSGKITGVAALTQEEIKDLFGIDLKEIPVELDSVKGGEYIWLGTYTLNEGDTVSYDVSAEKGDQMSVGFARPGDKRPGTVYKTITNRREDGKLEISSGPMDWESPLEPGEYSLFVHAPSGKLENVSGRIFLRKK